MKKLIKKEMICTNERWGMDVPTDLKGAREQAKIFGVNPRRVKLDPGTCIYYDHPDGTRETIAEYPEEPEEDEV